MKFNLWQKDAESPLAWESGNTPHKARTHMEYALYFNPKYLLKKDRLGDVLYFRCDAGNISCASHTPFACIWQTLEHESIGMSKYDHLKDATRLKGLWRQL